MAPKQTIMWTVLPTKLQTIPPTEFGGEPRQLLSLTVHISPRLTGAPTLASFPDWTGATTWPDTLATIPASLKLSTAASGAQSNTDNTQTVALPAVQGNPPNPAKWSAFFPNGCTVEGFVFKGVQDSKLHGYPAGQVVGYLGARYALFGLTNPEDFPSYEALMNDVSGLGAIAFEQSDDKGHDGAARKQRLLANIDSYLQSADAISSSTYNHFTPDGVATGFLQAQQFLTRGQNVRDSTKGDTLLANPVKPAPDFHQGVALSRDFPNLQRHLGLALDYVVDVTDALNALGLDVANLNDLIVAFDGGPPALVIDTQFATPFTHARLGQGRFEAAPIDSATTDYVQGWVKLSGPSSPFDVIRVEPDGSAMKALQFMANVSRSRIGGVPRTNTTPDDFALPHLRTGGFSILRQDRAPRLADSLDHQTELNSSWFDADNNVQPNPIIDLYLEDLVRGLRWDVLDSVSDFWHSLMWRSGQYHFVNLNSNGDVDVEEEHAIVAAPMSAPGVITNPPPDLYHSETMMRWNGWSLGVQRIGVTLDVDPTRNDGVHRQGLWRPTNSPDSQFAFSTSFRVPDNSDRQLPRLRFGFGYKFRARVVDLAGNSLDFSEAPPLGIGAISFPFEHLRFEPVLPPRVLLRKPHTSGESAEVVVIRSETGGVPGLSAGLVSRHVVPMRMAQHLAEQHGLFDDLTSNERPMEDDAATYDEIVTRDRATLENHPAAHTEDGFPVPGAPPWEQSHPLNGSFYYDVDHLDLTWMPELLSRSALLRDLMPENGNAGDPDSFAFPIANPFFGGSWPAYDTFRIDVQRSGDGVTRWQADVFGRVFNLTLAEGDQFIGRISSQFSPDEQHNPDNPTQPSDSSILGVWRLIQALAEAQGVDPSDPSTWTPAYAAARDAALNGRHWMLTPWRHVHFVHAVRTPLAAPDLNDFFASKQAIGDTFAFCDRQITMSRKSTTQLDVDGVWFMPVDTGINVDPETPQQFQGHAFTLPIDLEPLGLDVEVFQTKHEFGDTRFRLVDYQASATSRFVEFFREERILSFDADPSVYVLAVGAPFVAKTVKVTNLTDPPKAMQPAKDGFTWSTGMPDPPPGTGDYVLDPVAGTITRLPGGGIAPDDNVRFSFVRPAIRTFSPLKQQLIKNSARPHAPKPRYVLPTFQWPDPPAAPAHHRVGNSLRVWLDRPWWSSGGQERLGVVLWQPGFGETDPSDELRPFVTMWGYDPVFAPSRELPLTPTIAAFPAKSAFNTDLSIAELGGALVSVAGHDVHFDADRNLWYSDIDFADPGGMVAKTYMPFMRMALARYQPFSLDDCHLSKIVLVDYAQLAADRFASVAGTGQNRLVTVTGRAYSATVISQPRPPIMRVIVQFQSLETPDPNLSWRPFGTSPVHFLPVQHVTDGNFVTWSGRVIVPTSANRPIRLLIDELEPHAAGLPTGEIRSRVVYSDTFPITVSPT